MNITKVSHQQMMKQEISKVADITPQRLSQWLQTLSAYYQDHCKGEPEQSL